MKEPHGKGRASHPGPGSCGEAREGVAEAWTSGSAGERSSREIWTSTVPTLLGVAEGNTGGDAVASARGSGRSRSSSACTDTPCAGTGRSQDPAKEDEGPERDEKVKGRTVSMDACGKSESPMVPEKRSNKVGGPALCAAEGVEGRELLAKCNSKEPTRCGRSAGNKACPVCSNGCEREQSGTSVRGAKVMHCWPGVRFDAMTRGKSRMW
jgi:hypothetical protein